ncbi:MAG: efflux RND transporter permease subunit [Bacteroidales bacterium]|jgi:multidrug efflux pump subunit AcrB/ABC-type multidrug transport system ATPase subunit|nr:efflux RND transporter permease subunit [Bacteroidales bacterium]
MNFLIHRRITISMVFIALTLLGVVSYKQLSVELMPNAELPNMYVSVTSRQDMDPSFVETQVIIPLEGAINAVGGVDNLQTTVDRRQSTIQVDFKKSVNFKMISLRLEEKINEIASTFPEGFTVRTQKVDLTRMTSAFMTLQVRGSGGSDRVRNIVDKEIQPELENIDGVAAVSVYGGRAKAIEIQLDPAACEALNLSPNQISSLLAQNAREKTFVGYINEPDARWFVDVNSPYAKVADLENMVVAPGPVLLKDVAHVFFDLQEETTYSRVNGKESVSVSLTNDAQSNLIELSHRTAETVESLNKRLAPMDVEIVVQQNSAEIMEENINQIVNLALIGGLLAVVILWVFLRNIRLVTIIALAIPVSVYTAFNLFYAFGITLNSLTLIGVALAVGMLLDNSVVVLENVYRLSASGVPPEEAVTRGTKEVWRSIFAATLTTVTIFLPFVFSDNFLIKLLGFNVGVAIISTLTISLLVAMFFIPMAAYSILKRKSRHSIFFEKISLNQRAVQIYMALLKTCMRHPGVTLLGAITLLFGTLIMSLSMNLQTLTQVESDRLNISVSMQTGSTLDITDKAVRVMEDRLADFPEKKELICRVQEQEAQLTIVLHEDYWKIRKRNIAEIKSEVTKLLQNINGAEITMSDAFGGDNQGGGGAMSGMQNFMRMLGVGDNGERVVIKGSDYDMMQIVAEDIRYYLDQQDYIQRTNLSFGRRQPEISLFFDPIMLVSNDITRNNISTALSSSLSADITSGAQFKVGDDTYEIIIRNYIPKDDAEEERKQRAKTVDDLRATMVQSAAGASYQVKDIADINYGRGRAQIKRTNQDKQLEVSYAFLNDIQDSKSLLEGYRIDVDGLIADYNLPAGIAVEVIHEEDQFAEFKFLLLAAFILIFMILAAVFESFSTPFVLLIAIPLAAIGSLLALLFTGNSLLNANTLMGFLILIGVVVNNSIILTDYAIILRDRGYRRNRALIMAGLSRIRPILITSVTTIVAMFPMAMGNSEYAGVIGAPFAITVIGGLAFSTLLTLLVVPTAYAGLENTLQWYRGLPVRTKLFHLCLFLAGVACIFRYADDFLWQAVYLVALVILIPGMTAFAQTSLRRTQTKLISPNDEIQITISNMVKVYDRPGLFSREWTSGLRIRERLGIGNLYTKLKDFVGISWQFALFAFGVYFVFFFIESRLWVFLLSMLLYAASVRLWQTIARYLSRRFDGSRWVRRVDSLMYWGIPLFFLNGLYRHLDNLNMVIIMGFFWYACLLIYYTSGYIDEHNINLKRITGRYAGLKSSFFHFVTVIPVIGKRRKPFKALKGVSMEIKTGMFGLLGPNGAGKSTLMRIVSGILEQSYGSIWINGYDTRKYREELQGQIGFLPQEFGMYENMSAWDFLDYQAILKGIYNSDTRHKRITTVLESVHMTERKDDKIGSFSGGMKQRIGIALILLHLPRILIVDEPTAGLDPRERIRFRNLLVELSKDRIVIFSTHIIEDISNSCNQVVVINKGEVKYFGNPINMIELAERKVWLFTINKADFETKLDKALIIHHMQTEDTIQVRYLSATQPFEHAILAEPNLEDAYLCLLKGM